MNPRQFWVKVDKDGPVPTFRPELGKCWTWTKSVDRRGYGKVRDENHYFAHRWAYAAEVGLIPEGYEIDHLCRNTGCVRPSHLEAVTPAENMRRRKNIKTHCPRGHAYTPDNSFNNSKGYRQCRACRRAIDRAGKRRRRANRKEQQ